MSDEAKHLIPGQESLKIEYNQPKSSPYATKGATIHIGYKEYVIPRYYLQQHQLWNSWSSSITLSDVDEDVGHTFVHFLYTGAYETLSSAPDPGVSCAVREYKRSVLAYHAARKHRLPELEVLSKKYIEHFGESISIFDILRAAGKAFSKLPDDEGWLLSHIKTKLQRAFESDETIFKCEEFNCGLGEDLAFCKAVLRTVIDIYSTQLLVVRNTHGNQKSLIECGAEDPPYL
ncbi:hypothetical protein AJ80_10061, partial [Polytolypa hystricis UAMH7299]